MPKEWEDDAHDLEIEHFENQQDVNLASYLSQRPVPQMVKSHLRNYQNNIQDLKISLYTDPGSFGKLPRVFCGLQRLDIYHNDQSDIIRLFENIESVGASLKRLSLTAANVGALNGQLDAWVDSEPGDLTRYTPMLEELRLANFVVLGTFGAFDRVIDFYKLSRLELLVDKGGNLDFVMELAERAQGNRFKLKHIALEFMRGTLLTEDHLLAIMTLFSYCEPIESLHLRFPDIERFPARFFNVFDALPHNLQSLSISFDDDTTPTVALHNNMLLEQLRRSSLNGIKQLAYQFDERDLTDESNGSSYDNVVESLRGFQQLRLLHIRVEDSTLMGKSPIYDDQPLEEVLVDPYILALQMQTFANRLFEDMHRGGHSKLDALVVGHATSAEAAAELQQQCFVRGEQRDILGRTVPVGVPVSQAMLRETQPHTDILDIDFPRTSSSNGFEGWAGEAF
ncbi:hypothetical protein J4E93_010715 [Alternaria ventricosa]|uniref:uncharacterized protein n=1 Tax=Alternaria ventricosa TaxID=1187951 RepID=UPI0020C26D8D|nr:uncharacterized protein J4E93_010715 [Alternaria ventricosa]KAI4637049.1 hypothetical protein J4E93_010715 [Alternaria ventricosa]